MVGEQGVGRLEPDTKGAPSPDVVVKMSSVLSQGSDGTATRNKLPSWLLPVWGLRAILAGNWPATPLSQ